MALPISSISLANTFGQWIIVTQKIVSELNNLDDVLRTGYFEKTSGTLYISSTGIGLSVLNTANFGNIVVANNATFSGNVTFNNPITVNSNLSKISGVDISENSIVFSTATPRQDTIISINRGIGYSNATLKWVEASKKWQILDVTTNIYQDVILSSSLGSTVTPGIVQLNDDYTNASTTQAATINAVKKVFDALSGGTGGGDVTAVFAQANTARTTANLAFAQANTARTTANLSFAQANTARTIANLAFAQANAAFNKANTAGGNSSISILGTTGWANSNNSVLYMTSTNGVTITGAANTLTINTPQDLRTTASPTFSGLACPQFTSPTTLFTGETTFTNKIYPLSVGNTIFKAVTVANFQLQNADKIFLNANNSSVILPSNPPDGNFVTIGVGNFTNTTIGRNGKNIMGIAEDLTINIANVTISLIFSGDAVGWKII